MIFHRKPNRFVSDVSLNVRDLKKSRKFYTEILGLEVIEEDHSYIYLSANKKDVLLKLYMPEGVKEKNLNGLGLYHVALLLPDKMSLANLVYHLIKNNIRLAAGDHLVSEAFYIKDPDFNDIELYIDRDPSEWTWHDNLVEMATEPVDVQNFITYRSTDNFTKIDDSTIVGHIHLYVSDLKNSEEFYTEGLGLELVSRLEDSASFMSDGQYHHHIAINTWQGPFANIQDDNTTGLKEYTLVFKDYSQLEQALNKLKALSYESYEENNNIYIKDPDHNIIKLTV